MALSSREIRNRLTAIEQNLAGKSIRSPEEDEILKATRRNDQWAFILQKLKPGPKGLDIYAMIEADDELQMLLASDLSTQDIGFKNKVGTGGDAIVDENSEISNRALEITAKEANTKELRDLATLILFLRDFITGSMIFLSSLNFNTLSQ